MQGLVPVGYAINIPAYYNKIIGELETRYTSNITKSTQAFNRLKEQSADFDLFELTDARLALRPSMEEAAQERIRKEAPDGKISIRGFWTDKLLREDGMVAWHKGCNKSANAA